MDWNINAMTLLVGLLIMAARMTDVTMGTIRTICIVQGRTKTAFILAFLEISLWLAVISTVLQKISESPILGLFYAIGFALGNVLGIKLEKAIAFGSTILRVFLTDYGEGLAGEIRKMGFAVTEFDGRGMSGPVRELYIVCRRRDLGCILKVVKDRAPDAFFNTEQAGAVSKVSRPFMSSPTGWRAILKKK